MTFDITVIDDEFVNGSQIATINASATGYGDASADITIADNDTHSITVSPTTGLTTTEEGATASFTVVLT